ncbi:MAG: glycosyltransferase family 4 protein, partial [Candidatus Hydrogenedentes bacterium]|nr:glycosyltransferase family 4 protein [Candidatus Hydrogenedentota bacterium]
MATIFTASYIVYHRDPRGRRQAEALVDAGHRVIFLSCQNPGRPATEVVNGIEVRTAFYLHKKPNSFVAYLMHYLRFFFVLAWQLTLHPRKYDLIHIHNMPDFLVLAAWLPRLLGVPVIHDVLDLMPEIYMEKFQCGQNHPAILLMKLQERMATALASHVLTVEERLVDILAGRGTPRSKISVVINLPDERIFKPRPELAPKGPDGRFVVVYHGTLAHRLGLDIAIDAVARAVERIPNLEFRIIGGGEQLEPLQKQAERLGLQDVVTFSGGYVPIDEIPERIADADVGLVPMRQLSATDIILPTKLLEYVLVGIPSIVPRTGTVMRYFDESMVEFFDTGDAESLAKALVAMYENPAKRDALRIAAAEKFLSKYRWSEHK